VRGNGIRSHIRINKDMSVAQILRVRTVLEMLLEGVAALDGGGGEGGLVDVGHFALALLV